MRKVSLVNILNFIILFDLIFGGSGRLVMIGSISLRTIIFMLAVISVICSAVTQKTAFNGRSLILLLSFVIYLIVHVVLIGDQPLATKLDFLLRYLYILLALFYETLFYGTSYKTAWDIRRLLNNLIVLFSLFSIALWIFSFIIGTRAYQIVEMSFFRPYVYGSFDFIGGRIPRIFMKSSIFVPIGLLFQLEDYFNHRSSRSLMKAVICGLAMITTFTTGFFVASVICIILLLVHKKILRTKGILIIAGAVILAVIIVKSGLLELMLGRYTGNYTTSYRTIQMESVLNEFIQKPLLGHGFGYEFTTIYGNSIRTTANFEISWGELLVDTGFIGFALFTVNILITLRGLRRLSKIDDRFYVFGLGIVLICLESFTNPFINNSIGLTYYALCAGMTNVYENQRRYIAA